MKKEKCRHLVCGWELFVLGNISHHFNDIKGSRDERSVLEKFQLKKQLSRN